MKKALLLVVALMLVAAVANAQPPVGYIGLFTGEDHTTWCASSATPFYPVEMWIMCLPSYLGQICAEFRICYPANVITSTVTANAAIISVTLGDLAAGMSVCYADCQTAWHWNFHQTMYVTDFTPSYVEICAHPDAGVYQFANCEPGFPVEPCIKFTNLYLNYAPPDEVCMGQATEDASWGAIKSMME